jgi:hypothetical protein
VYPVIIETTYVFLGKKDNVDYVTELEKKERKMNRIKYPIVYHPGYNFSAFGIQKLHPFDSQKYAKIYEKLQKDQVIIDISAVHQPKYVARHLIANVTKPPPPSPLGPLHLIFIPSQLQFGADTNI